MTQLHVGLEIWTWFHDAVFKLKHKLRIGSGLTPSPPPPPKKKKNFGYANENKQRPTCIVCLLQDILKWGKIRITEE